MAVYLKKGGGKVVAVFEKTATDFKGLGLGTLLPSACTVTEELNGGFELKLEHPYDPYGKWERIQKDRILYASTPRGMEPFRIYKIKPTMQEITVYARHIFYDLQDNLCMIVDYTGDAAGAMSHLVRCFSYAMPFYFYTDLTTSGTVYGEYINPIQALLSESDEVDSFVKVHGGELLRSGFSVAMLDTIGSDRGVSIRYGKNLAGLEVDEDISELKTRIIVQNDAGTVYTKDSPYIGEYLYPKIYIVGAGDAAINEMQRMAEALLVEGIDRPKLNIRVDFQILSRTEEYKDYAILEEVQLGDWVTVIHEKMKFSQKRKVIGYEWDAILEKYVSVELGDNLPSLATTTLQLQNILKSQRGKMTEIEISIDGIRTTVADTEKGLLSRIEQTADAIRTEVSDTEKGLESRIEQTADAIRSEVTDTKNGLNSKIEQTAKTIRSEISDVSGDVSKVEQTAKKIEWIVAGGTSATNFTLTSRMAKLVAEEIDITGFVTFESLEREGETTINGSNITTGEIAAEYINLGGLMEVHRTDYSSVVGGYIGYGSGDDGDNASTSGILVMDLNENNYFIATTSGVRMTYKDINAVYVISDGVHLVADDYGVKLDKRYGNLCPTADDEQLLGSSDYRWQGVYADNGEIQTSDAKEKHHIEYNMEKYETLFSLLKPTQFKKTSGKSDRYHVGYISQDVEKALAEAGLDSKDFAGFIKSPVYAEDDEGFGVIVDYRYALRYSEFVALNTHMIQKLMKEIESLKDEIKNLKNLMGGGVR